MGIQIRDPGIFLTLDPRPEWEKIRIRYKHPGSATHVNDRSSSSPPAIRGGTVPGQRVPWRYELAGRDRFCRW